jgi:hypothetical protein
MNRMKLAVAGAVFAGSGAVGALVAGVFANGTVAVNAASVSPSATTSPTASPSPNAGAFKSNEDATHEASESQTREGDENSGKAPSRRSGQGTFKPNENSSHESSESAAREAQEDAGKRPTPNQ